MSDHEEEFRFAPRDDDEELGLKPLEDEEEKIIAPDFPLDTNLRLMPVICSACRTRMYATEDQVGMWKVCPDCLRQTEIRYVEPEFRVTVELNENGGYVVKEPEVQDRPVARLGIDYRTVDGYEKPDVIPQRSFNDEQPKLESMLQKMLDSKEEKERIAKEKAFHAKVEEQMQIARKKRNETVGGDRGVGGWGLKAGEEKIASSPTPKTKPTARPVPVPPRKPQPSAPNTQHPSRTPFWPGFQKFLDPFLSPVNRKKLIMLFILGYLSNFFLEHVKSSVGRVLFDMHPEGPGHVMSWGEMGFFSVSFFVGVFFGIIWLILVLMFGISILTATASGRIKVERWIAFDLKIGLSYVFWTALFFNLSFYPGVFLIWTIEAFYPAFRDHFVYLYLTIFFGGPFFVFPVLFLSVMETDTFFKGWPKKTLGSLIVMPMLWGKFYLAAAVFSLLPFFFVILVAQLTIMYYETAWMQSIFYYVTTAFFETLLFGFFPLIYCRFLGRVSWVISQDYPEYEEDEE